MLGCRPANKPTPQKKILDTTYIHPVSPPEISVSSTPFTCETDDPSAPGAPTVVKKEINGQSYCVHFFSEGAAGSVYTTYTYETVQSDKLVTVTFTLRAVQCMNYAPLQQTECLREQKMFDPDSLATQTADNL